MTINEAASRGFSSAAEAYERARPGYPAEAIAWLADQLGLGPGARVADVGAGTGKLTRQLQATGAEVIAIEPVAAMREILAGVLPDVRSLSGTAEATGLATADVDAVSVGQAFHWFAGPRALGEFHRVLRPNGRLGLIWNSRDEEQPLQQGIEEIIAPYRGETPSHKSGGWRRAFDAGSPLFEALGDFSMAFEQATEPQLVADRVLSTSFIAALGEGERAKVRERVLALAAREPPVLAYRTEISVFARVA
jgi:SAM-dependent methyltransferase